jgi:hypothetical protein
MMMKVRYGTENAKGVGRLRRDRKGCEIKKGSKQHKVTFKDQIPTDDFDSYRQSQLVIPHINNEEASMSFNFEET